MPLTRRVALLALPAAAVRGARSAGAAASPPEPHPGAYALPDGQAAVEATLTTERVARTRLRMLDIAMKELGTGRTVTRYGTELTKQLHVLAVSGDFRTFLHEHCDHPDAGGHFQVPMSFPRDGRWYVYADGVPAGHGQQVFRFDVDINAEPPPPRQAPLLELRPTGLQVSDGRYAVRFDALDLRAGQEAELRLRILRDGSPAPDLAPYLGVAAHAVLIGIADLSYVHVHAVPASAGHGSMHAMHDMPSMGAPMPPGTAVPPGLVLHLRAPKAGAYALWLQFTAGGQVRTVPFVVAVA